MRGAFGLVIVGLAGVLTAWMVAANIGRDPATSTASRRASPAVDPSIAPDQVERLRTRLGRMPAPPVSTRNPFRFGNAHARPSADAPDGGPPVAADDAPPDVAPRPDVRLLGIAEDDPGAGRTAVLSVASQLYLARTGEHVAMRFLVKRVDAGAVELEDVLDASTLRLELR